MAKKSDILLKLYNEFPDYLENYKTRLNALERDFVHAKRDYQSYLDRIHESFAKRENELTANYHQIELMHAETIKKIQNEFHQQLLSLESDIEQHHQHTNDLFVDEDQTYQDILSQFEARKAEAFDTYIRLTNETNFRIDREMRVHHQFIREEREKLEAKKIEYQDLNSTLSNKLIWTMEKAKNALTTLASTLNREGEQNKEYLNEAINESLTHLFDSKEAISALFKTTTLKYEKERDFVRSISSDKRKPHSAINQKMIATFVKQISEVNSNRKTFEKMIQKELALSLYRLYPKIIEANANDDLDAMEKYIMQKEIIERKADYLLKRNQSMSDLLISKYQNEIKKIKIDSFKRFEEIRLTYDVPVAFFQNSVNVYSNFAFYLNEAYENLAFLLNNFKEYNEDYIKYRTDYIHNAQKSFEDYKINLLVKVNDITNHLTEYIYKIDELSHQIVTLESNNRLEIAELKKKMENLEVFGDYQKYIASLENDLFFAMHQHNKNLEKIQIEANYKNNLFDINREVLLLNQNKLEVEAYENYMLKVAELEKDIQALGYERQIDEAKAMYQQKIDSVVALRELARHQIIHHAKKTNYSYASRYATYLSSEEQKQNIGAEKVIDFVHHVQNLIDLNTEQAKMIHDYIKSTDDQHAYLKALEVKRQELIEQLERNKTKKNQIFYQALDLYQEEFNRVRMSLDRLFNIYLSKIKMHLLKLEHVEHYDEDIYHNQGYRDEVLALVHHVYKSLISLAYKYQAPKTIKHLESMFEHIIGRFVLINDKTFRKIDRKSPKKQTKAIKHFIVESYRMLKQFRDQSDEILTALLNQATKNDRLFIQNSEKKTAKTKKIINNEYERMEYQAIKTEKSQKKQLKIYAENTEKVNQIYKKQVADINQEYLQQVHDSEAIRKIIYRQFSSIVKKNTKELHKMIKFMDKTFNKEQKMIDKQYAAFQKSLETLKEQNKETYREEVNYVATLYQARATETSKTIQVLEDRIQKMPLERDQRYLNIKREKYELQVTKEKELQKSLAIIEREKYVSKPEYLDAIEAVKNRLNDDYVKLYQDVQKMENEFLNQFPEINDRYHQNFQEYLLNQSGNNEILSPNSQLFQAFTDLSDFYQKNIALTADTYKETFNKSNKVRDELRTKRMKSKEKQNRIING